VLMLLFGIPSLFFLNHQYSVAHPYVNDVLVEQYGINVRERISIEDACNKIVTNYDTNEKYIVACEQPDVILLDINTKEPIPSNINP